MALVAFDFDDLDAAFEELDARYLAGEAAAHAHTWSVIANTYAALQPARTRPTTANCRKHRPPPGSAIRAGDLTAQSESSGITPNLRTYIEAVHRLNDLGAVVTGVVIEGTSPEGFEAEWRVVATF